MRVVIDTNVYVSALVFGGRPQAVVSHVMAHPWQIATSEPLRDELMTTLNKRFGWDMPRVDAALEFLWRTAVWHQPVAVVASRDPKDDHVLGCALAAQARLVLTGDKDLLVLHPFRGMAILTPADFLAAGGLV
jgi:putative PIN family toxin of toxin-antitoxin system